MFKNLWILILFIYLIILTLYTWFAFQECIDNVKAEHQFKGIEGKIQVMEVIDEFELVYSSVIGVWIATMICLGGASLVVYVIDLVTSKGGF